jgi:hypothetical protein
LAKPDVRFTACRLMCNCAAMTGATAGKADDRARYGIKNKMTIAAAAG